MAFIIDEHFTTGSLPSGWNAGSTGDFGYATAPAPLEGSFSLRVLTSDTAAALYDNSSEITGEAWGHFMLNMDALPASSYTIIYRHKDTGGSSNVFIQIHAGGTVTIGSSGDADDVTTASGISAATTYHLWWRYKPGSGANSEKEVWLNTVDDRSGTASGLHALGTAGDSTTGLKTIIFRGNEGGPSIQNYITDVVQWANTDEFAGGGTTDGIGASDGTSTATSVGQSQAVSVGACAGTSTALGNSGVYGQSAGTSTATAVGAALAHTVGTSAGTSTAVAFAPVVTTGVGAADGHSTAFGISPTNNPLFIQWYLTDTAIAAIAGLGGRMYMVAKSQGETSSQLDAALANGFFYLREQQRLARLTRLLGLTFDDAFSQSPATAAPVNTILPAISGTAAIGQTLAVSTGSWANVPTSYTYQWKRDNVDIGGATANTYVIPSTTGGLSCAVTAINGTGSTAVRASSGVPRQFFLSGDSLSNSSDYSAAVQSALDVAFGAGMWIVYNLAHSGDNIANMETKAVAGVDPNIDHGHGIAFFHEYANQVIGIQGPDVGSVVATKLETFGDNRASAGGLPVYAASVYAGNMGHGKDGTEAHLGSEIIRSGYAGHGGVALVDFDDVTLRDNIINDSGDGVHWTSAVYPLCATKTVEALQLAGLTGGCGDLHIYAPIFTNLKTFDNPAYVYDPVNPLPLPATATHLQVTAGTGWDLVTHTIIASFGPFITADGPQNMYEISPAQTTGDLPGGTYILS